MAIKFANFILAPQTSLGKFPRAAPEVCFRILHAATEDGNHAAEWYEQTVEVSLGPEGMFGDIKFGILKRNLAANRVLRGIAPHPSRPKRLRTPTESKTPTLVTTLHKAREWRRQLDTGEITNQAAIARREGVSRARVTQVLMLLRLAPEIQQSLLGIPNAGQRSAVAEHVLRPIALCQDQNRAFTELMAR